MVKYFLFFIVLLTPAGVSAQTSLQGAGGGLQPQSSQTQNTGAVQPETAQLQNNNAGNALNQTQPGSLRVFSSPSQANPDAVASASSELKTDINDVDRGGLSSFVTVLLAVLGITLAVIISSWVLQNFYLPPVEFAPELTGGKPVSEPTAIAKSKKTKKTTTGKKRKSKKRY